jgi:hypothetical protein
MNLLVHGRVDGVCNGHKRSLLEAELPQQALDVHVMDEQCLCHSEVTVLKAHGREILRCTCGDQDVSVRLPDNLAVGEGVDMADEVQV